MTVSRSLHQWMPPAGLRDQLGISVAKPAFTLIGPRLGSAYVDQRYPFVVLWARDRMLTSVKWTLAEKVSPTSVLASVTEPRGQVVWRPPDRTGRFLITATAFAGTAELDKAALEYEVAEPDESVRGLRTAGDLRMVPVGDVDAFLRVALDLLPDIFAALDGWRQHEPELWLKEVVTERFMASLCYSALATCVGAGGARVESLVHRDAGKLTAGRGRALLSQLVGDCREGCTGLMLAHAAAYQDLLALEPVVAGGAFDRSKPPRLLPRVQQGLRTAFAALDEEVRVTLINQLRFPATAIGLTLEALSWCARKWPARIDAKAPNAYTLPGDLARLQGIMATLVAGGGPELCSVDADGEFVRSTFARAVVDNQRLPAFTLLFDPEDDKARLARGEWLQAKAKTAPATWRTFAGAFSGGLLNYVYMRPHYLKYFETRTLEQQIELGIDEHAIGQSSDDLGPIGWLLANLTPYTAFGKPFTLHRAAGDRLVAADRMVNPSGTNHFAPVMAGSFNPRLISKMDPEAAVTRLVLSNHALGLGLDFDWEQNPFLLKHHIEYLAALLDASYATPQWSYTIARAIGDAYDARLGNARDRMAQALSARTTEPRTLIKALQEQGFTALHQIVDADTALAPLVSTAAGFEVFVWYLQGGLLTLPFEFVHGMLSAGLGWGGFYEWSRDFMHFEYPPVRRGTL